MVHFRLAGKIGQNNHPAEVRSEFSLRFFLSADCKRGRKKGAARKLSKSVEKLFDTFERFLTFFALRGKLSKSVEKPLDASLTIFDVF